MAVSNTFVALRVSGISLVEGAYVPLHVLGLNITFTNADSLAGTPSDSFGKYVRIIDGAPENYVIAYRSIPSQANANRWTLNQISSKSGNTWAITTLYWSSAASGTSHTTDDPMSVNSGVNAGGGFGTSYTWNNTSNAGTGLSVVGHINRTVAFNRSVQTNLAPIMATLINY